MQYRNPILRGFYPDPSVCRSGDDFYLVTSTFEYFPGVPVFRSRNLVNWEQVGHCLSRDSQLPLGGARINGGIYAPTIRYHDGRFYMVTTNGSAKGHFYVWTDDPSGEWSEPIWVDQPGIDPDLFWDDDGSVWFSCTGTSKAIAQRQIDIETGKFLGETHFTWGGCGGKCPEAPHVYKVNGVYYLMIAEGGTENGHCVTIARGESPVGPWESCPHNPIVTHRSTELPIQATGHADIVEDQNGNWWMVCLGIRQTGYPMYHVLGRETFLAPMKWEDGWPVVAADAEGAQVAEQMMGHDGLPAPTPLDDHAREEFVEGRLSLRWNTRCNPVDATLLNVEEPGGLRLKCLPASLDVMEGQSWVGRRQQHYEFRATAAVHFDPLAEREEAGITVFQNILHHYEVAITRREGKRSLIVRRRIGSLAAEVACLDAPTGQITLMIEGDEQTYRLGYIDGAGDTRVIAKGEARYLSTEVGGKFTGVYLAMYATAHGEASENAAAFDWFEYEPK